MFASDSILGYETDTEVVHQPDCRAGDLVRPFLPFRLAFCCLLAPTPVRAAE